MSLMLFGYIFQRFLKFEMFENRTGEEFEKGHVDSEKVFNVPYWFYTPQGQENNPNFLKHVSSLFNQTDHLVVVITHVFVMMRNLHLKSHFVFFISLKVTYCS